MVYRWFVRVGVTVSNTLIERLNDSRYSGGKEIAMAKEI